MKIVLGSIGVFFAYLALVLATQKDYFIQCDGKLRNGSREPERAIAGIKLTLMSPFAFWVDEKRQIQFKLSRIDETYNIIFSDLLTDNENPSNYFRPKYNKSKNETLTIVESGAVSYVYGELSFFGGCDFQGDISKFSD